MVTKKMKKNKRKPYFDSFLSLSLSPLPKTKQKNKNKNTNKKLTVGKVPFPVFRALDSENFTIQNFFHFLIVFLGIQTLVSNLKVDLLNWEQRLVEYLELGNRPTPPLEKK